MSDTIVVAAASSDEAHKYAETLAASWVGPRPIAFRGVAFPDADTWLARPSEVGAWVVLSASGVQLGDVVRLCDRVIESGLSAVEVAAGRSVVGSTPGWIVRSETDPVETIAAVAEALVSRQLQHRTLEQELSVAKRGHADAAGEIHRLSEEMRLASTVQRGLVPGGKLGLDWYDAAVLFRPATFCSGDIYDVRSVDDDTVCFFVADAVGHGVPAALLTMVISRALRLEWREGEEHNLGLTADRLNRELCRISGQSGRFATAVVGSIDRRRDEIAIVNAGHPSPIISSSAGEASVDATGPLLGVFEDAVFDVERLPFTAGGSVVVYSDGFETALGRCRGPGNRRLPSGDHLIAMRRLLDSGEDCAAAVRLLEEQLDSESGSLNQDDDLTALTMRRVA
ncbi:MAG: PP2C family protein-serine/threonine phosphatase [Planctomycetota bacterium]